TQDRVKSMRQNSRKLVMVVDEQERKRFASFNEIKVENLEDYGFGYLDESSLFTLLSKEVIFQGYSLKFVQLLNVGNRLIGSWKNVMSWSALARLFGSDEKLVIGSEVSVSSG